MLHEAQFSDCLPKAPSLHCAPGGMVEHPADWWGTEKGMGEQSKNCPLLLVQVEVCTTSRNGGQIPRQYF